VDRDGDMDYIVMNAGLNSKYGIASDNKPVQLYYGDMEGNGWKRIIEAEFINDTPVPIRSLDCMEKAIPGFNKKFPTFRSYAGLSMAEIFPEECLKKAMKLEANQLESGILINNWKNGDSKPGFSFRSMPRLAQASPGFGVVASDFDGDGFLNIHAVQNLFTRESRNTGVWSGGVSVMLQVDEQVQFTLVSPEQTGLVVTGDAKGLTVCDLNGDGWPDLVATQNNGRLLAFKNTAGKGTKPFAVKLQGPEGNTSAIGSHVTVTYSDGRKQVAEVYGGSGYLSQSTSTLFFGCGQVAIQNIEVRWPDGRKSTVTSTAESSSITIGCK